MSATIEAPVRQDGPVDPVRRPAIGGVPRVDLLPASLREKRMQKRFRRGIYVGIGGVAVLLAAGIAGATAFGAVASANLAAEQAVTLDLLGQQAQYAELSAVQERIVLAEAAQQVGAGTEIDWSDYLGKLRATLPAGVTLTSVTVDAATPLAVYEQGTGPLEGARIATLTFTASSPGLPDVPVWIDALRTLPAFVDAIADSVTLDDTGSYAVNMTLHIGPDAYAGRFLPEGSGSE
ncbi:MAG: hypothetical protein JWP66_782 [Naasia sp.]|nr:hypothetical protein [Naasia sp.]